MVLKMLARRLMEMILPDDDARARGGPGAGCGRAALRHMLARSRAANDELRLENAALKARVADMTARFVALEADLADLRGATPGSADAQAIAFAIAENHFPADAHDEQPARDILPPVDDHRARADALDTELAARTAALADAHELLDAIGVRPPPPVERAPPPPDGTGAAPAAGAAAAAAPPAGERMERDPCVFCRDAYVAGVMVVRLPCLHMFHDDCLKQYLDRPGELLCPIDRVSINRADARNLPVWEWRD